MKTMRGDNSSKSIIRKGKKQRVKEVIKVARWRKGYFFKIGEACARLHVDIIEVRINEKVC